MGPTPFLQHLHRVCDRQSLSADEAEEALRCVLDGQASVPQVAAFLAALRCRGESVDELLGFARAMRAAAVRVPAPEGVVLDTCGTGGDGQGTFNISTVVAFVVAGAGVVVAKHGNRSLSSRCGSADVMEALGVRVSLTAEQMGTCLERAGIAFLFAPALHPAVRHAQPARQELRMRTVFNLLGPLANPAGATAQLVGAPSREAARMMAEVLCLLGLPSGLVVHAADGLDEVSTVAPTHCYRVTGGSVSYALHDPEEFGVARANADDLRGGGPEENAAIARHVLHGGDGAQRDIVLANAALALWVAGVAENGAEGMRLATQAVDGGEARAALERLVRVSNEV